MPDRNTARPAALAGPLHVEEQQSGTSRVLTVEGVLNSSTYRSMRDYIIKAALDEASAVVVDVSALRVSEPSALAVFTSAAWHLSRWPGVPLLLACGHASGREALRRNGVARYVPVHPDVTSAVDATGPHGARRVRRRVRAELPRHRCAVQRAQDVIIECALDWSHQELIAAAKVIAQELVENALEHTCSAPDILVESNGSTITVAVADASTRLASLPEHTTEETPSGLELVAALSQAWGCLPSLQGKTVWATVAAGADLPGAVP